MRGLWWCALALMLGSAVACIEPRWVGALDRCGDGQCDGDEDPATCPKDCQLHACGNRVCEAGEPTQCPGDCPATTCGDGVCAAGEDPLRCEADCPWAQCGNRACEPGESPSTCAADCFPGLCGNGLCEDHETGTLCPEDCPTTRAVDLLFVVDDSASMAEEQWRLRTGFPALLEAVRGGVGQTPDLHVGVISTNIGTPPFDIMYCEGDGDDGRLMTGPEAALSGAPYLVDVATEGCSVLREPDGTCRQHDCDAAACGHEPATVLTLDAATGCPRCRNFVGTPEETFVDQAALGTGGCGFEQPLEAMHRALDGHPTNVGFLREEALLAVVFLTDEDDCSARDPLLFNPEDGAIDSYLGPVTSFRCFEFGITCDVNNRTQTGVRHGCTPREDPNAKLYPLPRYADLLWSLKAPGQILVSVLAGPVENDEATVGLDALGQPALEPSCATEAGFAAPAIRLRTFASFFHDAWALDAFAHQSICDETYASPLGQLGGALRNRLAW